MEIMDAIALLIILLMGLSVLLTVVFFAGPAIIVWVAEMSEIVEAKKEEWRELIKVGKGDK